MRIEKQIQLEKEFYEMKKNELRNKINELKGFSKINI